MRSLYAMLALRALLLAVVGSFCAIVGLAAAGLDWRTPIGLIIHWLAIVAVVMMAVRSAQERRP